MTTPQPTQIHFDKPQWAIVRCPHCGKVRCEARPGSVVKWICAKCKAQAVVQVAA